MKKITFLFAFLLCAGMMTAQDASTSKKSCSATCAKKCEAKKSSASASLDGETRVASAEKAAEIAASQDESIEKKVCSATGSISYYKKTISAESGVTKMAEVKFDEMSNSFVSVDETGVMSAEKEAEVVNKEDMKSAKSCSKSGSKSCCANKKKGV